MPTLPIQFGSPTPVIITDVSGSSGTSANIPVVDAATGAVNATAPVYAEQIGWLDAGGKLQAVSAANPLPTTGGGGGGGNVTIVGPLGQALSAASVPVVLPAAQITTLTPPAAITNYANETGGNLATLAGAVSGSVVQSNTKQVNGVTTLAGAGAVGTGAQRVAVGQDTTTIAGSSPGTAGTASANVVTVQGIASMTKLLVTPDANSAVNVSQWGGATSTGGSGVVTNGSPRVSLATDIALPAGTNLLGKVSASDETSTIYNGTTALTPGFATISLSATGTLVAAIGGKQIRVLALSLMSNGTVNVKFQSHVSPTDLTGLYYLIANTGFVLSYNPVGWFQTITGEALDINLSGSIAIGGCLTYVAV